MQDEINLFNDLLAKSQFGKDPFWFSYRAQQFWCFTTAKELLVHNPDLEPGEAVEIAREFCNEFYDKEIKKK